MLFPLTLMAFHSFVSSKINGELEMLQFIS